MQNDAVIWQVINHGHCTYKVKTKTQNFCRNEYNVTGLCNRSSCPLANSRYATIREEEGRLYLYMKTIERAHTPKNMWQKIRLKRNYAQALEQVDSHLQYWPKFLVHKNKQRLTKITQYLIRMRRLALRPRTKLMTMPARTEKRDARREVKALKAAKVESAIEAELLSRLKQGTYGDIYNFDQKVYEKVLQAAEDEAAKEAEEAGEEYVEADEESEEEEEDEDDEAEEVEYVNEEDVPFDEELEDLEDYDRAGGSGTDEEPGSSGDDEEGGSGLDEGPSGGGAGHDRQNGAQRQQGGKRGAAAQGGGAEGVKRRRRREPASIEYEVEEEREDLRSAQQARQRGDW